MKRLFIFLLLSLVACQQAIPTGSAPPAEQPVDEPNTPETPENPDIPEIPEAPPPTAHNAVWSDPATWGGEVPITGQDVLIPEGKNVLLDVGELELGTLSVEGALIFDRRDIRLSAEWIKITGRLEIGSKSEPFTHNATITLTGPDEDIMGMSNKFLVATEGGVIQLHGETRTSWARLAKTLAAGDTTLELDTDPDWRIGDKIVVASTDFDYEQAETFEVVSVSGTKVSLDRPAEYLHWGESESYSGKTVDMRAEVGLLSRNIKIQGDAVSELEGFGGHFMAMGGELYVNGVELYRMGQRAKMGRYPVHWHLMGDDARGQFIAGSSIHHSFNRCVTIHGSNGVFVQNNVAFNAPGHCFFLEDGIETDNVFEANLGLSIHKAEEDHALLPSDLDFRGPATYWITNPANTFKNNVSAGSRGAGFWIALPEHPTGPSATDSVWPQYTPLALFEGNVAHSSQSDGLHLDGGPQANGEVGSSYYRPSKDPGAVETSYGYTRNTSEPVTAVFRDFTAYKNRNRGVWLRGEHHILSGARLADNAIGATFASHETVVEDSLFVGESANKGTPEQWMIDSGGVGPDGRSLPRPWEADFPIRGFEYYDGKVSARSSHFARFLPNEQREASALSYLRFTAFSVDPYNNADGLSFEDDGTKRVYLELDEASLKSPKDVSRESEDGYRSAVFLDKDGSVTGTQDRYVVVDNPFMLTETCTREDAWVAWVCNERYAALSVYPESAQTSVMLTREDNVSHTMFGAGESPSTRFRTLLLPEREYNLSFSGAPQTFRVVLQKGAGASVRIKFSVSEPPTVTRYGRPQAALASLGELETASSSSYYYDAGALTLYLKLVAEGDYEELEVSP